MKLNNELKNKLVVSNLRQLKHSLQKNFNNCEDCKWACKYIDYILDIMEDRLYENL